MSITGIHIWKLTIVLLWNKLSINFYIVKSCWTLSYISAMKITFFSTKARTSITVGCISTVLAYLYTKRSDSEDLPIILPLGLVWCICGYNFSYCTPWKTAKISKMFWRGKILIPTTSSSNWKFQGNVNWRDWERLDIFSSPKPVSCL